MKIKYAMFLTAALIAILVINSCKKDNQGSIQTLFTGGTWQLASVMAYNYIGNSQTSIDTLNSKCTLTQFFTFNKDNTCTYINFDCITQTTTNATWSLTPNQLILNAQVICKDTTAVKSSKPFENAQIINLGQFSLILQTGDIQPNYSLTKKRRIIQYGFVRQKLSAITP